MTPSSPLWMRMLTMMLIIGILNKVFDVSVGNAIIAALLTVHIICIELAIHQLREDLK